MSALANLNTYWTNNATLQGALPISSVFLGLLPPSIGTTYPYAALTVVSQLPTLVTSGSHIEELRFQLALYHTDYEALCTLADTIDGQFFQQRITTSTLIVNRANRLTTVEINDQVFTYQIVLEYVWSYNTSTN